MKRSKKQVSQCMAGLLVLALVLTLLPFTGAPMQVARAQSPSVRLSEIRIDQPSTDNDEYFELAAEPGTSLDGLTYLVIGDGSGGSGVIEAVVDLSGQVVPASGYFVAAEGTFALGAADLIANLSFENSDNVTHLLVSGFSGANGADLDTNDDGVLDAMPWAELLDLLALVEEENPASGTEYHYGPPSIGPDGSYVPGHVFRCEDGWHIGAFDPSGGNDTPGVANCAPPTPEVDISEIRIDQPSTDNDEYFELVAAPGTSLDGLTYLVIGDSSLGSGVIEAVVALSGQVVPASGYFVAAENTFTLGAANLTTNLNFENSDNVTHLLVSGFNGANGADLDTNDDGVLDVTPWAELLDLLALVEEENPAGGTEYHYGPPSIGPDGQYVPGHVFRCEDGWHIGAFNPSGGNDTPGMANCAPPVSEVDISEIRIDQPSTDNDEYFELAAEPGTSLNGLTYLVIGDGSGGSGVVEAVVDLSGQVIPASGHFVAAEGTFTLGAADLTTNLNFENSDNVTHLLVSGFSGADGNDLDTNDDGTLDVTPWTELLGCLALVETVGSGEQVYCDTGIGPDGSYVPGHVFRCEDGWRIGAFSPVGSDDTPGAANSCDPPEACGDPFTSIYTIQSDGYASPLLGSVVSVEGIVTGDYQGANELDGFFIQDLSGDGNPATSDGVFVYAPGDADVVAGEHVRVRGTVNEHNELTEIGYVELLLSCGTGSIAATPLYLPVPVDLEPYEGMLVTFPEPMTASQNYFQGRYGQVTLSGGGRLYQPTNLYAPLSSEAIALANENMRRMVVLDDGMDVSEWGDNPNPIPYIGADNTLRAGDTVVGLTGVIDYGLITTPSDPDYYYRLHPTAPVSFARVNGRTAQPDDVGGVIKIASFNVLNYFNGDGLGGGFPTARGANTLEEFNRQRVKIVNAIVAMNADVVGLIEIENDGYGPQSAIQDLVNGLNEAAGAGTYAFVDPGVALVGTDEIAVGFVYKATTVAPVGTSAILDSSVDPLFRSDYNRPAIAQTFERSTGGGRFTAVVNHLKSKGSPCDDIGDPNQGDGQGNCNQTRTNAAIALVNWLATDPTGSGDPDVFIIGDLNAYAKEDPITAIEGSFYTNLLSALLGPSAYSYTFDGQAGYLDHSLASLSAVPQVSGATVWHINTDEPSVIDYNLEYKPQDLYSPTPYRSSDHDPVIVGFCDAIPPALAVTVTPDTLWPPNHKYVTVQATVQASDNIDLNPMVSLVSVVSNEPDNGQGDGDTPDDIVIVDDYTFMLRAERSGKGEGRIYTITYQATDACGNSTVATATVTVPHKKPKK